MIRSNSLNEELRETIYGLDEEIFNAVAGSECDWMSWDQLVDDVTARGESGLWSRDDVIREIRRMKLDGELYVVHVHHDLNMLVDSDSPFDNPNHYSAQLRIIDALYTFGVLPVKQLREWSKNSSSYPTSVLTRAINTLSASGVVSISTDRHACLTTAYPLLIGTYGTLEDANAFRETQPDKKLSVQGRIVCLDDGAERFVGRSAMLDIVLPAVVRGIVATMGDAATPELIYDIVSRMDNLFEHPIRTFGPAFQDIKEPGDFLPDANREYVKLVIQDIVDATESS